MMSNQTARGGTSISTVLLVVFVVLKLTDNITWSWIWVLSPLWIGLGVVVAINLAFAPLDVVRIRRRRSQMMDEQLSEIRKRGS